MCFLLMSIYLFIVYPLVPETFQWDIVHIGYTSEIVSYKWIYCCIFSVQSDVTEIAETGI
jgi:hypothetical protein